MAGTVTGDILIAVVKEVTLYPDTVVYPRLSLFPNTNFEATDPLNIVGDVHVKTTYIEDNSYVVCASNITGDIQLKSVKIEGNIKFIQHTFESG